MKRREYTLLFYDDLGRVVGIDARECDHDYESWEEARELMIAVPGATSFAVWCESDLICAEGEGAIAAIERLGTHCSRDALEQECRTLPTTFKASSPAAHSVR